MPLSWSSWALPGAVTALVAWTAAAVVLRTAPERDANRRLALVLILEGLFAGWSLGFVFFLEDPRLAFVSGILGTAAMAALPFQYLAFLGATLETPLVRPFRSRRSFAFLAFLSLAAAGVVVAAPGTFLTEPYDPGWASWNFQFHPPGQRLAMLHGASALFGLLAALAAYAGTPAGSAARTRALWFAVAFGVRDAYVGVFQVLYPVVRPIEFWGDFIYNPGQGIAYGAYVALLAYGVLRMQLFDLDLKLKFAIQQSTVGAIIAATFVIASEALEAVVPVEHTVLGVLIALGIVAGLRPIRSVAERLTNTLMRGVEETPEYMEGRKLEVFRAALEAAVTDGVITPKEEDILERLRDQLGILPEEALEMRETVLAMSRQIREASGPEDGGIALAGAPPTPRG